MKVAKYKYIGEHSYETVSTEELDGAASYVRISEYVDVDFPPLESDEQIQKEVSALSRVRESVVEKFTRALADIDRRKAELMAITHQA